MMTYNERPSLLVAPASSALADRRRNRKNLSLCLSDSTTTTITTASKALAPSQLTAAITKQKDDLNAYAAGPVKIMPFLYLGSEQNSINLTNLKQELGIQAILNVAAEVNNPYESTFQSMDDMFNSQVIVPSPSLSKASSISSRNSSLETLTAVTTTAAADYDVAYQKLPWEHNQDNLVVELQKAVDIIDRARAASQPIFVHCQCGVARSATVIIAYVMKTTGMSLTDAYNHVKSLAPAISPNLSLLFQLREYERTLLDTTHEDDSMMVDEAPIEQKVEEEPVYNPPVLAVRNNNTTTQPIKKSKSVFFSADIPTTPITQVKPRLINKSKSVFFNNNTPSTPTTPIRSRLLRPKSWIFLGPNATAAASIPATPITPMTPTFNKMRELSPQRLLTRATSTLSLQGAALKRRFARPIWPLSKLKEEKDTKVGWLKITTKNNTAANKQSVYCYNL